MCKPLQVCSKWWAPGCVKLDKKFRFVYLLQAGRTKLHHDRCNLGRAFNPSRVRRQQGPSVVQLPPLLDDGRSPTFFLPLPFSMAKMWVWKSPPFCCHFQLHLVFGRQRGLSFGSMRRDESCPMNVSKITHKNYVKEYNLKR